MTDVEKVRVELENPERDTLAELVVSRKLPSDLENDTVQDCLEADSLLERENLTDTVEMDNEVIDCSEYCHVRRRPKRCTKRTYNNYGSETKNINIAKGDFYWRNYINDNIPEDAVSIADGQYIGQVNYRENLLPVAIFPDEKMAVGEYYGKRVFDENIKILCSPDTTKFYWQSVDFNQPNENKMRNVVKGGYQDGYDLYIGKGSDPDESPQVKIGKVVPMMNESYKGLQVWGDDNQCVIIVRFEILKYGSSTVTYEDPVLTGFHWRDYVPGDIPADAIEGADGKYIGQISCNGDIPVAIYPKEDTTVLVTCGTRTAVTENIRIMCSSDRHTFYWKSVDFTEALDKNPVKDAVMAGYEDGFYLFVGRVSHEGEWKIGKVITTDNIGPLGLNVWDKDEKLMVVEKFEILKCDKTNVLPK